MGLYATNKYGVVLFDGVAGAWMSLQVANFTITPSSSTISYTIYKPDNTQFAAGTLAPAGLSIHLPVLPMDGTYALLLRTGLAQVSLEAKLETNRFLPTDAAPLDFARVTGQSTRALIAGVVNEQKAIMVAGLAITPATGPLDVYILLPSGTMFRRTNAAGLGTTTPLAPFTATGTYAVMLAPPAGAMQSSYKVALLRGSILGVDGPPAIGLWGRTELHRDGWQPPACLGWQGDSRLVAALAARFHSPLSLGRLAERLTAISRHPDIRFWAVTRHEWRPLVERAEFPFAAPAGLTLGAAAGTGAAKNVHEVGRMRARLHGDVPAAVRFDPPSTSAGGMSTLTLHFGVGNRSAAILMRRLSFELPQGVRVADPASLGGTCAAIVRASPGSGTVTVERGSLIRPGGCSVSANVIASGAGPFNVVLPAGSLLTDVGTNLAPASATLNVGR